METRKLTNREAHWILNGIPGVGPISLNQLLGSFNYDAVAALNANENALSRVKGLSRNAVRSILDWPKHFDLEKERERCKQLGVEFVDRSCERYPALLKEIHDPPIGLYVLGDYNFSRQSVAIVGSRRTTLYGRSVASEIARELSNRGICVVSGLARGIDTCAHKGALVADGGKTVAVLGCGIDIIYPPENIDLYREIGTKGAIVSEFPFGRRADRQTFPMRNRLVSGMSQAVIVIESDCSGGSMITARFAGEQGRLVCAVPGRIDQVTSRGCNQLIRDGALLIANVDDLLSELSYESRLPDLELDYDGPRNTDLEDLNEQEKEALKHFAGGEIIDIDRIGRMTKQSSAVVSSTLMMLELKGYLSKRVDGAYEAVSNYR